MRRSSDRRILEGLWKPQSGIGVAQLPVFLPPFQSRAVDIGSCLSSAASADLRDWSLSAGWLKVAHVDVEKAMIVDDVCAQYGAHTEGSW